MKDLAIKKLYYSIGEVSKMTSVKPYVLRYWETEFPQLNPSKNRAGKRIYKRGDVQVVLLIKKLLYVDKFTIDGARKQLGKMGNGEENSARKSELLNEIRKGFRDILEVIDS